MRLFAYHAAPSREYVPSAAFVAEASSNASFSVFDGYVPLALYQRRSAWYSPIPRTTPDVLSYAPPLPMLLSVCVRRAAPNPNTELVEFCVLFTSPTMPGETARPSGRAPISTR